MTTTMTKTYPVSRTDAEWRKMLTPEQYDVMRAHGTEAPGSCALLAEKRPGHFSCAGCDTKMLKDPDKYLQKDGTPKNAKK